MIVEMTRMNDLRLTTSSKDQASDCQSLGGGCNPSRQSRKISVGIMIDSPVRKRSEATKEDNNAATTAERVNSNSTDKKRGREVLDANEWKQDTAMDPINSPWITPRSFPEQSIETNLSEKSTCNLPVTALKSNKICRMKDALLTHSVLFFRNETSVSCFNGGEQKKFNGFTYRRKEIRNKNSLKEKEITFTNRNQGLIVDQIEERRTEALRMKLWEILGTVSSPKCQLLNCHPDDKTVNNLKKCQLPDQIVAVVDHRKNSDTIETDSETLNHTAKRPITRSLTQKRASAKLLSGKTEAGKPSSVIMEIKRNSISFEEKLLGKDDISKKVCPSIARTRKGRKKCSDLDPDKKCSERINHNGAIHMREASVSSKQGSPLCNKVRVCCAHPQNEKMASGPTDRNQELNSSQSAGNNDCISYGAKDQQWQCSPSSLPENDIPEKDFRGWPLKNSLSSDFVLSPPFKNSTPGCSPPTIPTPIMDPMKVDDQSPGMVEAGYTFRNICSFKNLQTSNTDFIQKNVAMELNDSASGGSSLFNGKKGAEVALSKSTEDVVSGSFEDGFPTTQTLDAGSTERSTFSPEDTIYEKTDFMLFPIKRHHIHDCSRSSKFNVSPYPTGVAEEEDELQRTVMLFAIALENFKHKVMSVTRKKSSEILMSVSDGIQEQLMNIESQLQIDMGKLTTINKSKRKYLETKFQEQQKQLKLIHDKFKQDIHQHLEDWKRILEGLEMNQIELKGTMKKQKASHQKLLVEVEAAVETHLNDAQRRITDMHKCAKEKMVQIRNAIAECLSEEAPPI